MMDRQTRMRSGSTRRWLSDRASYLWPGYGLAAVLIHLFFWRVSEPRVLFSDFYKAYYRAAVQLWELGNTATWPLGETGVGGFVNVPVFGYLFVPLLYFGQEHSGWVFLVISVVMLLATWALMIRLRWFTIQSAAAWLFLILANGPLVNSLKEGNTTHLAFCLLVIALVLWQARSEYLAGILLGACAVIKPPLLLYGLYFAARQRWRVVAGGAGLIGLTAILSLVLFGVDVNIGWYKDSIEPFFGRVMPALNVQSLDGFIIRLRLGEQHLFDWTLHDPTLVHRLVRYLIFAGILILFAALAIRTHYDRRMPMQTHARQLRDRLEYVIVLNIAIVASPISWTHYYLFLLLAWGLYLAGLLNLPRDRTTCWLMRSSMILASLPVVILPMQPGWLVALFARTAISAWLFGGLLCLAALMRGVWYDYERPRARSQELATEK